MILPGAAYTEKNGLYVNTEGRVQQGVRAVFPKGEAKEDWAILRALSERLGAKLPYDSLDALRAKLFADHPSFGRIDHGLPRWPRSRAASGRSRRRPRPRLAGRPRLGTQRASSPTRRSPARSRLLPDQRRSPAPA